MRFAGETVTLPSYETGLQVAGALATSPMVWRTILDTLIPDSAADYLRSHSQKIFTRLSSQITVIIEEFDGLSQNNFFDAATVYLGAKLSPSAQRIKVNQPPKETGLTVTIDMNQKLVDLYKGSKLTWVLVSSLIQNSGSNRKRDNKELSRSELRYFELSFHKKYEETVLNSYLPYILQQGKEIREENKTVKLHTIDYSVPDYWGSIKYEHPATFDTMVMDPEMKKALIDDLDIFKARKEYYRQVGTTWKRG